MVKAIGLIAVLLALAAAIPARADDGPKPVLGAAGFADGVRSLLYDGKLSEAAALAEQRTVQAPDDDQARFALGATQFLIAVEHLGQGLYRYGLISDHHDPTGLSGLPIVRLPVPINPAPQPLDYAAMRAVLAAFVADLERAERTLAGVGRTDFTLTVNLGKVRLDLDGDGTSSPNEALWILFQRVANIPWLNAETAATLSVGFDAGDAAWLQAYCNLLMAVTELALGYDWHDSFAATFHNLFPRADTPLARLEREAMERAVAGGLGEEEVDALRARRTMAADADLVAFIHLIRWPVVEPARLRSSLEHLEAAVRLSRESWRRIMAETDDDREWIPNPRQTGVLRTMPLSAEQVAAWNQMLDEIDAVLAGRKLIPHWRFEQGINLRRMFLEPTTLDVVMLIQGTAAIPYLEKGELASGETWRTLTALFGGDFLYYATWLN
jgi:hypothetical protein